LEYEFNGCQNTTLRGGHRSMLLYRISGFFLRNSQFCCEKKKFNVFIILFLLPFDGEIKMYILSVACSVLPNERIIRMMVDDTFRHLEVSHLLKAVQAEDLFLQNTFFISS